VLHYKFLARGGVAPFTGFRWPLPGPSGRGDWVAAPPGKVEERGIHACRWPDLPHWLDDELWEIELAAPVTERELQVVGAAGRLTRRIAAWTPALCRALGEACAWRACALAAAALRARGLEATASRLAACRALDGLLEAASEAGAGAAAGSPQALAGYVADASRRALQGNAASVAFMAANLAASVAGDPRESSTERAWQARWLSEALALE
jgi:hypothetical protein